MNMLSRREFVVGAMTLLLAISLTAQRPAAKASTNLANLPLPGA